MAGTDQIAELNRRSQQLLDMAVAAAEAVETAAPGIAVQLAHLIVNTGSVGFAHAARFWCDRLIQATPGATEVAQQDGGTLPYIKVMIADAGFTALTETSNLPPRQRWACDLIAARMSGHQANVHSLITQVGTEPTTMIMHLADLLSYVSAALHAYRQTWDTPARPGLRYVHAEETAT